MRITPWRAFPMTPAHGDLRQTTSAGIADKTCSLHFRIRHSPAADHHSHSSISSCSSRYPLGMCAHKPRRITQVDIGMFTPGLSHTTQVNIAMVEAQPEPARPRKQPFLRQRPPHKPSRYCHVCSAPGAHKPSSYWHVRPTDRKGEIPVNRYFPLCPGGSWPSS